MRLVHRVRGLTSHFAVGCITYSLLVGIALSLGSLLANAPFEQTWTSGVFEAIAGIPFFALLVLVSLLPGLLALVLYGMVTALLLHLLRGRCGVALSAALWAILCAFMVLIARSPQVNAVAKAIDVDSVANYSVPAGFVGISFTPFVFSSRRRALRVLIRWLRKRRVEDRPTLTLSD